MPIYAFACNACGHEFERLQKMSDPDPNACPECSAEQVQRQLTAPQFRLSGSGWYETDFKKAGETKRNLADGGSDTPKATASESKTETKSESKPAPAATSKPAAASAE